MDTTEELLRAAAHRHSEPIQLLVCALRECKDARVAKAMCELMTRLADAHGKIRIASYGMMCVQWTGVEVNGVCLRVLLNSYLIGCACACVSGKSRLSYPS
jgi:hypothetical protein